MHQWDTFPKKKQKFTSTLTSSATTYLKDKLEPAIDRLVRFSRDAFYLSLLFWQPSVSVETSIVNVFPPFSLDVDVAQ